MARAISTQVKEFMDMWLSPTPPPTPPQINYSLSYRKYPYDHTLLNTRLYEYSVKDIFQLLLEKPYELDLMGNYKIRDSITYVLKETGVAPDYEELNKYKQIVIHRQTYTGVFNMECGTEEKVIEITILPDEKHLQ